MIDRDYEQLFSSSKVKSKRFHLLEGMMTLLLKLFLVTLF